MTNCEFCNSEYDENNFTSPVEPIPDGICFHCGSELELESVPNRDELSTDNSGS